MVNIKMENLRKEFDTPSGRITAVDDINLEIQHGDFFTFVGPSGCGKTTTLRMLAGLETPTSGKITFDGEEVTRLPPQQRDIAMVFQNVVLYPHMTNFDNIAYGLRTKDYQGDIEDRVHEVAQLLEIEEILDQQPDSISGGQRQRVALGRAIAREPNAIFMDEPMSDLDAKLKATLRVEVQRVHEEIDTTIVYVTHDQEEAMTMSDQIALMNNGHLEQVDSPVNMYNSPVSEFSSQFIGQPSMNILDVTINQDGQFALAENGTPIDLGEHAETIGATLSNGRVRVGFRPRDAHITTDLEDVLFTATTEVWEPLGHNYAIHLTTEAGENIDIVVDELTDLEPGDVLGVNKIDRLYFFDPDSGQKIEQVRYSDLVV
jgi:multiple sugar transport system ATP-binding protein